MLDSTFSPSAALFDVQDMLNVESRGRRLHVSEEMMMERAGQEVAQVVQERCPQGPLLVMCGPGNNGGDGFVAARFLSQVGRDVEVAVEGTISHTHGWKGPCRPLSEVGEGRTQHVVDALFGSGLSRSLPDHVIACVRSLRPRSVVAVDVPSGVNATTGEIHGTALPADVTVTFCRPRLGHVLYPGRSLCGDVVVCPLGLPQEVFEGMSFFHALNTPHVWRHELPSPHEATHKYTRGMALITSGRSMTGACFLAVRAAQRVGAGYVWLAAPDMHAASYRRSLPEAVVAPFKDTAHYKDLLQEKHLSGYLIGPGLESTLSARERVLACVHSPLPGVVDGGGLSLFFDCPSLLWEGSSPLVLTPHEGEFKGLFPDLAELPRLRRAQQASQRSGCVVVLKGADTIVASPDGRTSVHTGGTPFLATAGTGDVLAGLLVGLLAQGMPCFEAALAAVWLHGKAALSVGAGLVAGDLITLLPHTLKGAYAYEDVSHVQP